MIGFFNWCWSKIRRKKPVENYVMTVYGITHIMQQDNKAYLYTLRGYWILKQTDQGKRIVIEHGDAGHSEAAELQRSSVDVWANGGPLPNPGAWSSPPNNQPPKTPPSQKPKIEGKIITLFPENKEPVNH